MYSYSFAMTLARHCVARTSLLGEAYLTQRMRTLITEACSRRASTEAAFKQIAPG